MLTTIDWRRFAFAPDGDAGSKVRRQLYFLTGATRTKTKKSKKTTASIFHTPHPSDNTYVSVSGTAETYHDQAKIERTLESVLQSVVSRRQRRPEDPRVKSVGRTSRILGFVIKRDRSSRRLLKSIGNGRTIRRRGKQESKFVEISNLKK